jgi:regulator of replication initiation timing
LVAEAEAENQRLEGLVSGLTSDVEDMNTDLSSTILEIHALATDIETLDAVIVNSEAEITSLDDREVRIRTARDNDNLAFANR